MKLSARLKQLALEQRVPTAAEIDHALSYEQSNEDLEKQVKHWREAHDEEHQNWMDANGAHLREQSKSEAFLREYKILKGRNEQLQETLEYLKHKIRTEWLEADADYILKAVDSTINNTFRKLERSAK